MDSCIINSPLGFTYIEGNTQGISAIRVLNTEEQPTAHIPETLKKCTTQLQEYFIGQRQNFNLTLNPKGTDFQKQVWHLLAKIPYGKTLSYLELSKQLGNIKAIRAVANANAKNPLWIVVPCHRVIGSDGSLTGYAGGLYRKQWLLQHESPTTQQTLF